MLRKIKLSEKRKKWIGTRTTTLKGKPLNYNAAAQLRYQRAITALMYPMLKETKKKIEKLFNGRSADKFFTQQEQIAALDSMEINIASLASQLINELLKKYQTLFNEQMIDIVNAMYEDTLKSSEVALKSSLTTLSGGLSIDTSTIPSGLKTVSKAIIKENVELFKTIPNTYFHQVQGAVMRSITTESGLDYLIPELDKYGTRNLRHTRNAALDQTRKAYNGINKQRMLAAGIKRYEWLHSGGGQEPRKDHIAMDGNIYSFEEPPVIDKRTGERGIPGDAINCRCTMNPVIEFEDGEVY